MMLNISDTIQIDHITVYARNLEITSDTVRIPNISLTAPLKDVKEIRYGEKHIVKDGKLLTKCIKDCEHCIMHRDSELNIFTGPSTYTSRPLHYCSRRGVYSEDIGRLPHSRLRDKHDLELQKEYELIKEKYYRKGVKHITDESIKQVKEDIDDSMTPNAGGEPINEYGHHVIDLEKIHIRKNKYGYTVRHEGRMGDYGWWNNINLHPRCDIKELERALRETYNTRFEVEA